MVVTQNPLLHSQLAAALIDKPLKKRPQHFNTAAPLTHRLDKPISPSNVLGQPPPLPTSQPPPIVHLAKTTSDGQRVITRTRSNTDGSLSAAVAASAGDTTQQQQQQQQLDEMERLRWQKINANTPNVFFTVILKTPGYAEFI
jgi:hypothetical protein